MFDNIGEKIKTLAKVLCWIGIIAFVIFGIIVMTSDDDLILTGLLIMIFGSLVSWVSSFFMYGFGDLITSAQEVSFNTSKLRNLTFGNENPGNAGYTYGGNASKTDSHTWRCSNCGQLTRTDPCSCCGFSDNSKA